MGTRKTLAVRASDPAVLAWQRSQAWEAERDGSASWMLVPFRMFVCVTFLGTLLQVNYVGMALPAALATATSAGLVFALAWAVLTYMYGGDLPQIFIRSLLIFSLIGLWFSANLLVSPGWRGSEGTATVSSRP
jgi:hypothetical protein